MRRADRGFSLLEMMVALAVFSLAALALVNLATENVRAAGLIETRTFAAVIAENHAVEALTSPTPPPLGKTNGVDTAADRVWHWTQDVSVTADPTVWRIDVSVRAQDVDRVVGALTVFREAP